MFGGSCLALCLAGEEGTDYFPFLCFVACRLSVMVCYLPFGVTGFVCVEVLRPSQPNGVMSSAVSLPNHTFTGQA